MSFNIFIISISLHRLYLYAPESNADNDATLCYDLQTITIGKQDKNVLGNYEAVNLTRAPW